MKTATIISVPGICELREVDGGAYELQILWPLSLTALRDSDVGQELMCRQDWYDDRPWAQAHVPAGKYSVRLPIPDSNNRTREEQGTLLLPGEELITVVLGGLTLLCLAKAGYPDSLKNGVLRCAEKSARGNRVVLCWCGGRLNVCYLWSDDRHDVVWAGGVVRTS